MILAHKKHPERSEKKRQDSARSDESKLEEDVVGEFCEEKGAEHGESIIMPVEM